MLGLPLLSVCISSPRMLLPRSFASVLLSAACLSLVSVWARVCMCACVFASVCLCVCACVCLLTPLAGHFVSVLGYCGVRVGRGLCLSAHASCCVFGVSLLLARGFASCGCFCGGRSLGPFSAVTRKTLGVESAVPLLRPVRWLFLPLVLCARCEHAAVWPLRFVCLLSCRCSVAASCCPFGVSLAFWLVCSCCLVLFGGWLVSFAVALWASGAPHGGPAGGCWRLPLAGVVVCSVLALRASVALASSRGRSQQQLLVRVGWASFSKEASPKSGPIFRPTRRA